MTAGGAEAVVRGAGEAAVNSAARAKRRAVLDGGGPGQQGRRTLHKYSPGYSRFVIMMKVLLPFAALLLIALVIGWPYMKLQSTKFGLGFSSIKIGDGADPSMINPRYFGTGKNRQTFSITADLAKNLLSNSGRVELEMPKADISLQDGSWLVVTANIGYYARQKEKLSLEGGVDIFHDSGYEFRTEKVDVDLANGTASGNTPVEGQGPFGHVKAEGFRLLDMGKTIIFSGKSKLTIYPGASTAAAAGR